MKFIVHISLPASKFNEALRDGSAGKKLGRILEETKPEAAYFTSKDGNRGGYLVYNVSQASEVPSAGRTLVPQLRGEGRIHAGHDS